MSAVHEHKKHCVSCLAVQLVRMGTAFTGPQPHCPASSGIKQLTWVSMLGVGGKPSIEVPSGEDFFNQHEHDNPEGFFDSLPDHPTPPADYTPSGMSAGGLDPNRRASSLGGAGANGITGEPSTPMAMDPNHIPEGAERVSGGG